MSQIRQLADTNIGSQRTSNISISDDVWSTMSTMLSALQKGDLDTVKHVIESIVEPLIRRIVKEELESVKERILTSMNQKEAEGNTEEKQQEGMGARNSGNKIHCSEPRRMQLRFLDKLPLLLETGCHIKGENCSSARIGLFDDKEQVVTSGPEASAKVEIFVLRVDPDKDEEHEWTQEEFNLKIVKAILTGNAFLNLKEGIGSLDEISFAHRAIWMKKSEFRLGARIVDNFNGTKVRVAKSECFFLKDFRNKRDEKHRPPSLNDEVWRLDNIGRSGPIVKRLSKENIKTVQDFLEKFVMDRQGLRDILGNGIPDMKLEGTLQHALSCKQLDKRFIYPPPSSQQKTRVVFDAVGQVVAKVSGCHCIPIDNLSETEKADAQKLVVSAFEHRGQIVPYDDNSPPNLTWMESPSSPNVGTPHMIAGYDCTQPSTSQGIVSLNNSIGTSQTIGIGDMELTYGTLEFRCEHSQATCQVPNDQMLDFMSMCQDIGKHFNQFLDESLAVAIDKAQRKWLKLSVVLRFSLRKRIEVEDLDHERKKQRLH
ncbi:calmodulin-binding protein 60 A-like isoform X1 [Camellia sinensis]|uniref:calmodulin-binding protein 60 A-like isoform X1 n=1 Tax=Camellia sinensis TaxID=4442 RepID=UPI00103563E5|nr:calmodulin-binding protein 60 A-like isoform X1 [Camellia sinensis]